MISLLFMQPVPLSTSPSIDWQVLSAKKWCFLPEWNDPAEITVPITTLQDLIQLMHPLGLFLSKAPQFTTAALQRLSPTPNLFFFFFFYYFFPPKFGSSSAFSSSHVPSCLPSEEGDCVSSKMRLISLPICKKKAVRNCKKGLVLGFCS